MQLINCFSTHHKSFIMTTENHPRSSECLIRTLIIPLNAKFRWVPAKKLFFQNATDTKLEGQHFWCGQRPWLYRIGSEVEAWLTTRRKLVDLDVDDRKAIESESFSGRVWREGNLKQARADFRIGNNWFDFTRVAPCAYI